MFVVALWVVFFFNVWRQELSKQSRLILTLLLFQAVRRLKSPLLQHRKCWDCRYGLPCPALESFLLGTKLDVYISVLGGSLYVSSEASL